MEAIETVGITAVTLAAFGVIKLLINKIGTRNGKPKTQTMLESRFVALMDAKQDRPVCDEKHKAVDEKTTVLFRKVDSMAKQINEIHISVIKGE